MADTPLREARQLALGGAMAFLAGAVDVYGVTRLGGHFVSFMSGNTTLLGQAVAGSDTAGIAVGAELIGLFVAGAALGSAVAEWSGNWRKVTVTAVVTALLAAAAALPGGEPVMALAMGALNSALTQIGPASVSLTYVTGTLARFGQGLGRRLAGKGGGWGWLLQAPMWACLLAGAITSTILQHRWGAADAWPVVAGSAGLTAAALVSRLLLGADAPKAA